MAVSGPPSRAVASAGDSHRREQGSGVYSSLAELMALRHAAQGFSAFGRQNRASPLAGRRATRLRGRGLAFEELRDYRPGDDVRAIDWKVTARMQKPHTRVYAEERERPVLLVVDQRLAMFFGSVRQMKSVAAAELAAILAWQVVAAGDRVGALIFGDANSSEIEPRRDRRNLVRVLEALVEHNHALAVDAGIVPAAGQLDQVLEGLARRVGHDWIIVIVSDFHGHSEATRASVRRLARHNDVIAVLVYDAPAVALPARRRLMIGDTRLQAQIDTADPAARAAILALSQQRLARLERLRGELDVPLLAIDTGGDVAGQLRRALAGRP